MSDIFGLNLSYHVFTPEGDLYVSDSNDGDRWLVKLARQYPGATVIVKDRNTGEALTEPMPLTELLQVKDELLAVSLAKRAGEGAP
jgi:hypothetical protein